MEFFPWIFCPWNYFHAFLPVELFPMEFFLLDFFSVQFFPWNFSNGILPVIFFSMEIFHDISGKCNSKFYKKIEKYFHKFKKYFHLIKNSQKFLDILWKIMFFYGRWISVVLVSWKFHRFWRSRWIGSQSSFHNYNRVLLLFSRFTRNFSRRKCFDTFSASLLSISF